MSIIIAQELKQLQSRLAIADAEYDNAKEVTKNSQKSESEALKKKNSILKKIEELKNQTIEPILSEHAVLRYIERVYGLDLEKIKEEMLPTATKNIIMKMGSGKYPSFNCKLVVKDKTIVTIEI